MPGVREKLIALPPKPSAREIAGVCLGRLKAYAKKYGSIHFGIAVDPQKRFRQHNERLKKPASGTGTDPWAKCVVFLKAESDRKSKKVVRILTKWQKSEYGPEAFVAVQGGGGRKPTAGESVSFYVLLDRRAALWKRLVAGQQDEDAAAKPDAKPGARAARPGQGRVGTS